MAARLLIPLLFALLSAAVAAGEAAAPQPGESAPGVSVAAPVAPATTALVTPAAPLPPLPLKSEFFNDVVDSYDDQEEAQQIEAHCLEDILAALQVSPETYLNEHVDKDADFTKLMLHPESFRGHVVQFESVLRFEHRLAVPQNKTGISEVTKGQVANSRGQVITFIAIDPVPPGLKLNEPVQFTGIFLKRYAYISEAKPGDYLTWTPLVFVKRLVPYEEPPEPVVNPMESTTAIVIFLIVGVGLGFYFYTRVKTRTLGSNYFTRLKQQKDDKPRRFP